MTAPSAAPYVPASDSLDELRLAAASCRGCDLWEPATQVVFGEGRAGAPLLLVGEQPGDVEDQRGQPFVGPAGKVLDRALKGAGIRREDVYVTNAVKHFKFVERGKRRIHQKPGRTEVVACRPWLEAELAAVRPTFVVLMGATATSSLLGPSFKLMAGRGAVLPGAVAGLDAVATIHPSAVLRAQGDPQRDELYDFLVHDLGLAAAAVKAA
jgi:uracil-DNA glycosylase